MVHRHLIAVAFVAVGAALSSAADPFIFRPPVCAPLPQKEPQQRTAYGTKAEFFSVQGASLRGVWQSLFGPECPTMLYGEPRCRVRLVKWNVTEACPPIRIQPFGRVAPPARPLITEVKPGPIVAPTHVIVVPTAPVQRQ